MGLAGTRAYALISMSSTSNTSVAPPGILGGEPWSPAAECENKREGVGSKREVTNGTCQHGEK